PAEIQAIVAAGGEGKATQIVTTAADIVNPNDAGTSLPEAINASNASVGDRDVIGFDIPNLPTDATSWGKAEGNSDDSTDVNNGSLQNGATCAAGVVGQAFSLDGSNDFVSVPDADNLGGMPQVTVETWVKFNSIPATGLQMIIAKGQVAGVG